jgi:membrane protease YdiL (CAAX protease family)
MCRRVDLSHGLGADPQKIACAFKPHAFWEYLSFKEKLMKNSLFAERHPYWFTVILEITVIFVYLVAGTIAHFMNLGNMELYGLANLSLTIIVAVLLSGMGWWKAVGFRAPQKQSDLLYFIVPFFPMFINFIPGVKITGIGYFLEVLIVMLMVGFVEEVVFRGLMLQAIKGRGNWKAIVITSLLFGLTHALNTMVGKNLLNDVLQIFYAVAIGFAFAALVLKKGLLWPLVLAHFLINFVNFIQPPGFTYQPAVEMLISGCITIVFTVYGVAIMLEKSKAKGA